MNTYFPLAVAAVGVVVVMAYTYSRRKQLEHETRKENPAPQDRTLVQMSDLADEWMNPMNVTSNLDYVAPVYSEPGPYGIPRTVYRNSGNAMFPTYGNFYRTL